MNWQKRYEEKPVTKFEAGRYYRYIGHTRPTKWHTGGKMDGVLDGNPTLCTTGSTETTCIFAAFEKTNNMTWAWSDGIENWREV